VVDVAGAPRCLHRFQWTVFLPVAFTAENNAIGLYWASLTLRYRSLHALCARNMFLAGLAGSLAVARKTSHERFYRAREKVSISLRQLVIQMPRRPGNRQVGGGMEIRHNSGTSAGSVIFSAISSTAQNNNFGIG